MCYTANCLRIKQTMEIKVFQSKPKRVLVSYRNEELISMNKKKKIKSRTKTIHSFVQHKHCQVRAIGWF